MKGRTLTREEIYDAKEIHEKFIEQGRWYTLFERVIEIDGEPWIGYVREASTEQQEGGYDDDVKFFPAVQVEKVVVVWEARTEAEEVSDVET